MKSLIVSFVVVSFACVSAVQAQTRVNPDPCATLARESVVTTRRAQSASRNLQNINTRVQRQVQARDSGVTRNLERIQLMQERVETVRLQGEEALSNFAASDAFVQCGFSCARYLQLQESIDSRVAAAERNLERAAQQLKRFQSDQNTRINRLRVNQSAAAANAETLAEVASFSTQRYEYCRATTPPVNNTGRPIEPYPTYR